MENTIQPAASTANQGRTGEQGKQQIARVLVLNVRVLRDLGHLLLFGSDYGIEARRPSWRTCLAAAFASSKA